MQVFVKNISGTTYTIDFDENTTVEDLKIQYEKISGTPINHQDFICGGKYLSDNDVKLVDCGVSDKTTVHFALKLHGG